MNSIQKYVLSSLFVRNQITEEKLAQAIGEVFVQYAVENKDDELTLMDEF